MRANTRSERKGTSIRRIGSKAATENVPAWEMIEVGRYMPRRIRGSFRGRELG
jgi:hypothetical protein